MKHPFSRSYGVILPSSLTRVLPLTLVYSTCLPVSVCGTGTIDLARGFSCQCGIRNFATLFPRRTQLPIVERNFLLNSLNDWPHISLGTQYVTFGDYTLAHHDLDVVQEHHPHVHRKRLSDTASVPTTR